MIEITSQPDSLVSTRLRTPKAAAIAGLVFSLLLLAFFWLLRRSVPADPLEPGTWVRSDLASVALALNLIPFAGVAFLWFIGVLRDRLGQREDRFFATVFFGSALLFLGMLFVAAAVLGAIVTIFSAEPDDTADLNTFHFARVIAYNIANVYALKMAAVFMISTSTVAIQTRFAPRWLAILGFASGAILLLGSYYLSSSFVVFPIWVFLISSYILIDNYRRPAQSES